MKLIFIIFMTKIKITILIFIFSLFSCKEEVKLTTGNPQRDIILMENIEKYITYYDSLSQMDSSNYVLSIKEYNIGDTCKYIINANPFLSYLIYDSVYYCAPIKGKLYCSNKKYKGFSDSINFFKNVKTIFPKEYKYYKKHKKFLAPEYIIENKRLSIEFIHDSLIKCQLIY